MKKLFLFCAFGVFSYSSAYSQARIVLVEQFSNSSCPPCATYSPVVYNFANNNPTKATVIAYHTVFPYNNDSMYHDNIVDPTQRASYYAVASTPTSVMDGNQFKGSTATFNTNITNTINNRAAIAPRYTIQNSALTLSNNQLTGSFQFTSVEANNANENLIAHIVVIEKNVLKSSYAASPGNNSETHYEYVMRKMIPSATGTALINKNLNGTDAIALNWTLSKIKNINEVRVVAFVQNSSTKEVYQAMLFTPQITTNTNEINDDRQVLVYPNPSENKFSISLENQIYINDIEIIDLLGRKVYSQKIDGTAKNISIETSLTTGIYNLSVNFGDSTLVKKINIVK